jgi:hypothetical protein
MSAVHSKDLPAVSFTPLGQAMPPTRTSGNWSFSHLVIEAVTLAWSTMSRPPTVIVQGEGRVPCDLSVLGALACGQLWGRGRSSSDLL